MTLKDRLLRYMLKNHSIFVSSGELQRLVTENTSYTPSNASRRLRELENEGKLIVELRSGHAWYKAKETSEQWFDSVGVDKQITQ